VRAILAYLGLAPAPDPAGPAPPQPDTTPRPPGNPRAGARRALTVRSACSSIDGTSARAAVCATHVALDDAPYPGSRIAAGAGSEPVGLDSREGPRADGSTTLGSFRGSWMPAAWAA